MGLIIAVLVVGGLMIDGAVAAGTDQRLAARPDKAWAHLDNARGLDTWWRQTAAAARHSEPAMTAGP